MQLVCNPRIHADKVTLCITAYIYPIYILYIYIIQLCSSCLLSLQPSLKMLWPMSPADGLPRAEAGHGHLGYGLGAGTGKCVYVFVNVGAGVLVSSVADST